MMEFTFTLKYHLSSQDREPDSLIERLGEAGCRDALIGIGQPGRLTLEFTREGVDANAAICSAHGDVMRAIPSAGLADPAGYLSQCMPK